MTGKAAILEIESLRVKYGNVEVLHGIDLTVRQGEIVAILGANGAGKSTTLLTISGLVQAASGAIRCGDAELHRLPGHEIVKRGIAQVPEGRRIFGTLSVQENLSLGAFVCRDGARVKDAMDRVYALFPRLAERRDQLGGTLSGGEQQMLAIGRALMSSPRVLLLDEPSLGLAPLLVKAIFKTLEEINRAGVTILLVEQNARAALRLAHRGYVMEVGQIVLQGPAQELASNPEIQSAYLGS
ncbi:MAG: ABC transporter ATP-binding protein [Syntrophobacteraceae bacterium]|jgi:branched-chain amino acid transport system ATP-binding protein|nr:ABC transporter ATP-binding protein [Syntrophobacteraceae bacterium]